VVAPQVTDGSGSGQPTAPMNPKSTRTSATNERYKTLSQVTCVRLRPDIWVPRWTVQASLSTRIRDSILGV